MTPFDNQLWLSDELLDYIKRYWWDIPIKAQQEIIQILATGMQIEQYQIEHAAKGNPNLHKDLGMKLQQIFVTDLREQETAERSQANADDILSELDEL